MKAVVATFNQEKALVGAFSVITNLRMELFEALVMNLAARVTARSAPVGASSVSIIHFYDSPDNNLSS